MSNRLSKHARRALVVSLVAVTPWLHGCKSGVSYAEDIRDGGPVEKSAGLLYFAEEEREELEPETRNLFRDTLAGEPNPMVRAQAAYVLGTLPYDPTYIDWLLGQIRHESHHVRFDVVVALGKLGPSIEEAERRGRVVTALRERLASDDHSWVKLKAARALGAIGDRSASKALVAALGDTDPAVRLNAHRALIKVSGQRLPREKRAWEKWLSEQQ